MNAAGAGPIRILLVDHQPAVRRGLKMRLALEPDMEVVGEAGDADEAVSKASDSLPDVVLMDVAIPGDGGIAATAALRAASPGSAVVIFTLRDDAATQEQARAAGAAAFVAKRRTEEMLLATIRGVAKTYRRRGHAETARQEESPDGTRDDRDP